MRENFRRLLIPASVLILLLFTLFVINQTAGVVDLAEQINPTFGQVVLWALIGLYCLIILVPIVVYLRMPQVLDPPEDTESPAYAAYIGRVRTRLAKNPRLADLSPSLDNETFMAAAHSRLDAETDKRIKTSATTVFITTAISQNGLLDGIMVLSSVARLIWEIAHIYYQRPSLREMLYLYANVAVTTFFVVNIEDLDIDEQVEVIISRVIGGSVIGGIPGATGISTFVTTSFINGSVNALLTLRVGVITRSYFAFYRMPRRMVKRNAAIEAARLFGGVFVNASGVVTGAIMKAYRRHAGEMAKNAAAAAKKTADSVADSVGRAGAAIKRYVSGRYDDTEKSGTATESEQ